MQEPLYPRVPSLGMMFGFGSVQDDSNVADAKPTNQNTTEPLGQLAKAVLNTFAEDQPQE